MMFEDKGSSGRGTYLVCSNARRGRNDICHVKTRWLYRDFETSLLLFMRELDLQRIVNEESNERAIQDELDASKGKLHRIAEQRERIFDILNQTTGHVA